MARDIAIFGAGGFGRETALMIRQMNQVQHDWNLIGFFDDGVDPGSKIDGYTVLGGINELDRVGEKLALAVTVSDPAIRKRIVSNIKNVNLDFPVLKHPSSLLGDVVTNRFGRGCIITAGNILTLNIEFGEFVIVNLACTIGHDVQIKSFSTIMPGCSISGNVVIGESTLVGTGVRILQNVTVGDKCKIGAGAVVVGHTRNDVTLVGVPAKEL